MENIGDWLYVIIIIVAAVSSIFGSIRKKAQQTKAMPQHTTRTTQTTQAQPREIFRGDTFDDDFWGPEKPAVMQQPKTKQPPHTTQKQNIFNFQSAKEGQKSIEHFNMDSTSADNEEEFASITIEDLPSNTEDWRKAFIFNEIISRKH